MAVDAAEGVGGALGALETFDADSRDALFAHCVSLSVNAVHEAWNRRPKAFAHADRLAQAVDLDMAASWTPTAANFLGRVTKARILQAVAEGRDRRAADRIEHLKKVEMATEAETLLSGSGWLPEPLRTPGRAMTTIVEPVEAESGRAIEPVITETAAAGGESAVVADEATVEDEEAAEPAEEEIAFEPHAIAAE